MDLQSASQAHSEWKVKLRMAISKKEQLDATTISADNCCPLGKWLHGEAKSSYGQLPAYRECLTRHAAFHKAAGDVARLINSAAYDKASAALEGGTAYASASSAVGSAILALRKATGK